MAKNVAARVDKDHREALDRMVEDDKADSRSEAFRQTSQHALADRGYLNGDGNGSSWLLREIGKLWAYLGVGWLGFTLFYPVSLRVWVVVFFIGAVVSFGTAEALDRGVIGSVQRGESKAA